MDRLSLSVTDLIGHAVSLGMDVHPPLQIPQERTRLNIFYEEMRNQHPGLFDRLAVSDTEFVISKDFVGAEQPGVSAKVNTFCLTPRGPVVTLPLLLFPPIGETGLESSHLELFTDLRKAFFSAIPGLECVRLGLVRELIFQSGDTQCYGLLTKTAQFSGATLSGGKCQLKYRDTRYNHNIVIEPAELTHETRLPIGQVVREPGGFGVKVVLDVNNRELRALADADMEEIIERARSLWPGPMLEFLGQIADDGR